MRRLKAVLRELARDGKCGSAGAVGRAAGVAKTGWLEYLNGRRSLPRKDKRAVVGHVRDVLGIATPWPELEAIVDDDDETAKAKSLGERCRESNTDSQDACLPVGTGCPTNEPEFERRRLMQTRLPVSREVRRHFGLERDPFTDDVQDADGVFLGPVHKQVMAEMLDRAQYGGFGALVAPVGWGKTILRKTLTERLRQLGHRICVVQQLDRENLTITRVLDALLADFGGKRSGSQTREAKSREVKKMLEIIREQGGRCPVLMIDEAHALHPSTLRGLKRLFEIEDGHVKLLSIVLFGQPQLYSRLGGFDLEEVTGRLAIVMAYGLDTSARHGPSGPEPHRVPPSKSYVPTYIAEKLRHAGAKEPEKVIDLAAMRAIAKITDVPIRINTLASWALNETYRLTYDTVTLEVIEQLNSPREGK